MAELTVVYWRDIPAQVMMGRGRGAARAVLPERFEKAIDRAAMRAGAKDGDAYPAEWRRVPEEAPDGDPQAAVGARLAALDAEYDDERLKALALNEGRA
ncbi:MAG: virulence factor [Hasllibacter sp.]